MADSVLNYLDTYCERAGDAGPLGEPLNLLTNLCFVVAAVLVAHSLKRATVGQRQPDLWLLALLMFIIGLGSGAWHLMPAQHTLLMDVVPIGLFIHVYLISGLRRLFTLSWFKVVAWWGLYLVASIAAQKLIPPDTLNGSVMYAPTWLTLVLMTLVAWRRDRLAGRAMGGALLVWTASLTFRTIDNQVCGDFVIGTHFLWHVLNAWVLWRLTMVLVARRQ